MTTYCIVRFYQNGHPRELVQKGLSLSEAQEHCRDPESSSRTSTDVAKADATGPWFDGYEEE